MEPSPPRVSHSAANRWTLEPIAFLIPFLGVALAVVVLMGVVLTGEPIAGIALAVVLMLLIVVPTLVSLRRKR